MKKITLILGICAFVFCGSISVTSCRTGYGCETEEQYKKNQGKPLSKKKGKSKLFK